VVGGTVRYSWVEEVVVCHRGRRQAGKAAEVEAAETAGQGTVLETVAYAAV
jgi:hypothetical protein